MRAYDTAGSAATTKALFDALGVHSSDVLGYWDGHVTQHGPGTTTRGYFTELTVTGSTQGAIAGKIDYPDLHCGGRLRLTNARGIVHVFREQITSGRANCGSGGTIYATVLGGAMSWRWVARASWYWANLTTCRGPGIERSARLLWSAAAAIRAK